MRTEPAKNLLIYADGRVEETKGRIEGVRYIQSVNVDGAIWCREFEVDMAYSGPADEQITEDGPKVYSMVAIERSFTLKQTAAERAKRDAETRAETMKKALWGIANYPGDE